MRAQPSGRRAVARFAGNALGNFKRAPTLLRGGVERMAHQTLWRFFRLAADFQDARHAFPNVAGERLIRAAVLVLQDPGGIFVLQDAAAGNGLDAAVATGGRAGAWTNIFDRLRRVRGRGIPNNHAKKDRKKKQREPRVSLLAINPHAVRRETSFRL